jgi:hypothetical protein
MRRDVRKSRDAKPADTKPQNWPPAKTERAVSLGSIEGVAESQKSEGTDCDTCRWWNILTGGEPPVWSHLDSVPVARSSSGCSLEISKLRKGTPLKKIEQNLQRAARCREMAETAPGDRQRLKQIAQSLEMLAELEKRLPAEDDNVIEFVLPPNDPKRKQ